MLEYVNCDSNFPFQDTRWSHEYKSRWRFKLYIWNYHGPMPCDSLQSWLSNSSCRLQIISKCYCRLLIYWIAPTVDSEFDSPLKRGVDSHTSTVRVVLCDLNRTVYSTINDYLYYGNLQQRLCSRQMSPSNGTKFSKITKITSKDLEIRLRKYADWV